MERGIQRIEGDDEWGTAEISGNAPGENAGPKMRFAGKDRKRPCALADAFVSEARQFRCALWHRFVPRLGGFPTRRRIIVTTRTTLARGVLRPFPAERVLGPA